MIATKRTVFDNQPPFWVTLALCIFLVGAVAGLVFGILGIFSIGFLFDAPGSENNPIMPYLVKGVIALPIVSVVTAAFSLATILRYTKTWFLITCVIGLSWPAYMSVVNHEMNTKCGGNFGCPAYLRSDLSATKRAS